MARCCGTDANGLHARIVTAIESQFSDIVAAQPTLLARHCAGAGLIEKAIMQSRYDEADASPPRRLTDRRRRTCDGGSKFSSVRERVRRAQK
jgi:hypothetical protein